MKKYLLIPVAAMFLFVSCKKTQENKKEETKTDSTQTENTKIPEKQEGQKLKFVDFSFGDAEHYYFESEDGKQKEFGFCKDRSVEFAIEVPPTDKNQGFGPNPKLQGKWFLVKSAIEKRPLYQDGPEGDVDVILEAKEVK